MGDFDFFITSMPGSRPADYHLGCLGGSIFLDFNNINGNIYLVRISFDGYGCCCLDQDSIPLNKEDSDTFKKFFKSPLIDKDMIEVMVKKLILLNKSFIWTDALVKYQLI